jgi:hypothetical protein
LLGSIRRENISKLPNQATPKTENKLNRKQSGEDLFIKATGNETV